MLWILLCIDFDIYFCIYLFCLSFLILFRGPKFDVKLRGMLNSTVELLLQELYEKVTFSIGKLQSLSKLLDHIHQLSKLCKAFSSALIQMFKIFKIFWLPVKMLLA